MFSITSVPKEDAFVHCFHLSVIYHGLFWGSKRAWATPRSVSFRGLLEVFSASFIYISHLPYLYNKVEINLY